jgi:hypothetical protein
MGYLDGSVLVFTQSNKAWGGELEERSITTHESLELLQIHAKLTQQTIYNLTSSLLI